RHVQPERPAGEADDLRCGHTGGMSRPRSRLIGRPRMWAAVAGRGKVQRSECGYCEEAMHHSAQSTMLVNHDLIERPNAHLICAECRLNRCTLQQTYGSGTFGCRTSITHCRRTR